jgi:dephospho-CoA kinase
MTKITGARIALAGKMRSGKDTVADYLGEKYKFKAFAFGNGIKQVCSMLDLEPTDGRKPRALYQDIGQYVRKYDPNVWVSYLFKRINQLAPETNIVVTDVRQPNEVKSLRERGFVIIKVDADEELRLVRARSKGDNFTLEDLNHETETAVDTLDVDFTLFNNLGYVDLYQTVDFVVWYLFEEKDFEPIFSFKKGVKTWEK